MTRVETVTIMEIPRAVQALSSRSAAVVETKRRRSRPLRRRLPGRVERRQIKSHERQRGLMMPPRPSSMRLTEARRGRKAMRTVQESPSKWTSSKRLEVSRPEEALAPRNQVMMKTRWSTSTDCFVLND